MQTETNSYILNVPPSLAFAFFTILFTNRINSFESIYQRCQNKICEKKKVFSVFFSFYFILSKFITAVSGEKKNAFAFFLIKI